MFKLFSLLRRNRNLTHREFRDYYEGKHRLIGENVIGGYATTYERNYLYPLSLNGEEPIYDAVTQETFPDRETCLRCISSVYSDAKISRIVDEDEARFLDRESCLHLEAQDCSSTLQPIRLNDDAFRTFSFACPPLDRTYQQCRDHSETRHRHLVEYLVDGSAALYTRHYLYKMSDGREPEYPFIAEIHFEDKMQFDMVQRRAGEPSLRRVLAEDEAKYIDRDSAVRYRAEVSASVLRTDERPIAARDWSAFE